MAWGLLTERLCKACRSFSDTHPAGICSTCRRDLPLNGTVCRPCRKQASLVAGPGSKTALDLTAAAITGHQLFLAGTFRRPNPPGPRPASTAPQATSWPPPPARASQPHWIQAMLCDPPRDLTRVSSHHPSAGSGLAGTLLACARRTAELRGWSPRTLSLVSSGLRILAAVHDPGEPVRASTVQQLKAHNIPAGHVIDVLDQAGALLDDRPGSLTVWLQEQISGFPSQIRAELEVWIDVMRSGGDTPHAPCPQHDRDQFLQHPPVPGQRLRPVRDPAAGNPAGHHVLDRCAARPLPRPGRQHTAYVVPDPEDRAAHLR